MTRRRLLFLAALFTGGCLPNPAPRGKRVIGISVLSLQNPFFKEIADNLHDEAAKFGFDVVMVSGEMDPDKQDKQVTDFLVRKVDAIVLSPCNSRSIATAIDRAASAGVPVFTVDIACLDKDAKVVTHVATDNYAGGKQAGLAMLELVGQQGGEIGVLNMNNVESCMLRVKGFKEVIEAHNAKPGTAKIAIKAMLECEGSKDRGYKSTEDMLQAHPNLAAIFAINDPAALGARAALEKAGRADRVKLVGFDGQPEGKIAIGEGKIYADPIQFPDEIGRKAAQMIVKYFNGEDVPAEILIETKLYRQADAKREKLVP